VLATFSLSVNYSPVYTNSFMAALNMRPHFTKSSWRRRSLAQNAPSVVSPAAADIRDTGMNAEVINEVCLPEKYSIPMLNLVRMTTSRLQLSLKLRCTRQTYIIPTHRKMTSAIRRCVQYLSSSPHIPTDFRNLDWRSHASSLERVTLIRGKNVGSISCQWEDLFSCCVRLCVSHPLAPRLPCK
jgi:hypothetical protein